jgi:hypothetical protein
VRDVESGIRPAGLKEADVSFAPTGIDEFPIDQLTAPIESICSVVRRAIEKLTPNKATVEFGIEVAVESGKLTSLLVKGSGTANLKITLEWTHTQSV